MKHTCGPWQVGGWCGGCTTPGGGIAPRWSEDCGPGAKYPGTVGGGPGPGPIEIAPTARSAVEKTLVVLGAAGAAVFGGYPLVAGGALWELFWWARRVRRREVLFDQARAHADTLGVPLVVVGAPDQGPTRGAGCGDITIDIAGSGCPTSIALDICEPIPLPDASAVIYVSCVLEYVADLESALRELRRIAVQDGLYVVRVEPWTLTAYLYPGARRTLSAQIAGRT